MGSTKKAFFRSGLDIFAAPCYNSSNRPLSAAGKAAVRMKQRYTVREHSALIFGEYPLIRPLAATVYSVRPETGAVP